MDILISVLAVLALLAGIALGTFRHRSYGVWSFFGVLIAITVASVAGSLFGTYLNTTVNGDIITVTVLVKITLLVTISLLISYYCDNLVPLIIDPKTRADNIYAGLLGFVNSSLIVGSIFGYLKTIPSTDPTTASNVFANRFNDWMLDALPWLILTTLLYVIGLASVRKINQAIKLLKESMQKSPTQSASNTTGSLPTSGAYASAQSANYQSPAANFGSTYTPSSSVNPAAITAPMLVASGVAAASIADEPKQGFLGRLFGGFGRKEEPVVAPPAANLPPPGYGGYGLGANTGYGSASSGYQAPMSSPSGATPPYGINTGSIAGANPSYGTPAAYQSPAQSSFGGYGSPAYNAPPPPPAPAYTPSNSFGQPSSPSGYQPSFGSSVPGSGYTTPTPYNASGNYIHQDEDPDYTDQSSYPEDNDREDDTNDGYNHNGSSQPPPYRG